MRTASTDILASSASVGVTKALTRKTAATPEKAAASPASAWRGGEAIIGAVPAPVEDTRRGLLYATKRMPVRPRDDRTYTVAPDRRLHFGRATLLIGAEGSTSDELREWTTRADAGDRPFIHLERVREQATLGAGEAPGPEAAAWLAELDAALAASRDRDVLVYVHGALPAPATGPSPPITPPASPPCVSRCATACTRSARQGPDAGAQRRVTRRSSSR